MKKSEIPYDGKERLEFRYYDMPQKCPVLCLYGDRWKMTYGIDDYMHFHNVLEIGICREGTGKLVYANEEKEYKAGDISIIPRNIAHSTKSDYSWWEYIFIDAKAILDRFLWDQAKTHNWSEKINSRTLLIREETHVVLKDIIESMFRESKTEEVYRTQTMIALAMELLFLIARENREFTQMIDIDFKQQDETIREVMDYMDRHFAEDLTISEIAGVIGISETHFRRLFRQIVNMTPMDYLNMLRVRNACNLLLTTDMSVEIIAERSGFLTPSTFNRNFKRYLGTTPLQWKKEQIRLGNRTVGIQITAFRGWGQEVTE
ncbi:MAG: AraC family transcriptional regulator [Eubacteriales bacterium]|nr:AraC family transcriptional regulator [Eubacteriales bacterium]